MRYFPLFYDLDGRHVVVVGGGEEALRKIRLLLKTNAKIHLVAGELPHELAGVVQVQLVARSYDAALLQGAALVLSADQGLNAQVSADAMALGIPVNAVDQAEISSFIVPSIVDRSPVVVAIGTEGAAPVLAQGLRARIDALLPENLGALASRAANLRNWVGTKIPAGAARRGFWHDFFFGTVAEAARDNDEVAIELAVGDAAFNHLHGAKGRVSLVASLGDAELITLKAQRRLMEADVIYLGKGFNPALLEMARRDAERVASVDGAAVLASAHQGRNAVVLSRQFEDALIWKLEAEGLPVEALGFNKPEPTSQSASDPFPVREDLRAALLQAAS
ncbi:MAG: siroheme synthase [Alphaproteobacteria bacterium]|nr:siroheme synthase [Alphaproteobacteria bacterium]